MMISEKYEVLAEIRRGGMGVVYKVRHVSLNTIWALKILPQHATDDRELMSRFHREARVMAQLDHPNIVRVVDVDMADGLHYFVMEYIEGRSLSHVVKHDGARSLAETLDVAIQATAALAYAHGRNPAVIHRDIKPSNILLEAETGRAVVTDFGLAKLAGGTESIQTESGQFVGTLRYCAPEQLIGASHVDARIDVYGMGMVIYEMCVGQPVYVDLERPQVIAGLLQLTEEHPFQFARDTPEELQRLIARATAKDRDQRHATAAALLADLQHVRATLLPTGTTEKAGVGQRPAPPEPARAARRRPRAIAFAALAGIAGLGVAVGLGVLPLKSAPPREHGPGIGAAGTAAGKEEPALEEVAHKFISVMDFTVGSPDPRFDWMRDAIRDNLNRLLSSAPDCKVFSKEFIDFKAQQMVREGQYKDIKAATMEAAQKLGVTKAVLGSFRADDDSLHIEAHLVDMKTGVQEASETVEGDQKDFVELQASLARKLMDRLGLAVRAAANSVPATGSDTDLENYRLLLEAEGQGEPIKPAPKNPKPAKNLDLRGQTSPRGSEADRVVLRALRLLAPDDALAADTTTSPSAEDEIRGVLETYRRACAHKDLALLNEVYDNLTPSQIDANRRYFENAQNLKVYFEEVDVALGQDEAAVSYTRLDRFVDAGTKRPTTVEVRLTKIFTRVNGAWKIAGGRRQ